jgi:uncharacterized phage protein (TIGR02220 family)
MIESEIWEKPPLYIKVWMYLLMQAQHKPYKGLKRGQLSTSIPEIIEAVAWRVGARKERPTKDQVFQILDWLRSTKTQRSPDESNAKATMITTTKATQSMLINVDGYCHYQDISNYESNDESNDENPTKPVRKQREPDNTNKNVNNVNKVKNDNKYKDLIVEIINYLNEVTEKTFSPDTKETIKLISGRLTEGKTVDQFKHVINVKSSEWKENEKMNTWLKPNTLFCQSNFEAYLNQFTVVQGGQNNGKYGEYPSRNPKKDRVVEEWESLIVGN